MRTVFLGSPPFATPVFERLVRSRHRPLALVTLPDKPKGRGREVEDSELVRAARAASIPVLQPERPNDAAFVAELRALAPDVLVVASYGVLLKQALLELAPHGALNVHGSLLPRWRGASPIQAAIREGDAHTGVSIQRIVLALDEGDVLLARERPIGVRETSGAVFAALAELGGEALLEALERLEAGTAVFTPQDARLATYARKLKKEHGALDWKRDAQVLERHVRAMNPWPLARMLDPKGRELSVLEARVVEARGEAGRVLEVGERFVVACGERALELVTVQAAGKKPMSGPEFLRGARLEVGQVVSAPAGGSA
ncbi:MAG: methionyl-tRNA formyltransferase [Planctomycetes bacterium]|nr:methionyl-tRNA formyltransferase [Planctomycetota bacterium]